MTQFTLAALVCLTVTANAGILVGPVRNQASGHDYYLIDQNSWLGAEIEAQRMDGHLAVIETAEENLWVSSTFRSFSTRFWLGYSDTLVEGTVRTVDGRKTTFRNFLPGQPDNANGHEDFVEMWADNGNGRWNDWHELGVLPGLVEVSSLPDVLAGPIRNPANGSTYYLLSDSSWARAQAKAVELGGNLVTVSSKEENDWLLSRFMNWDAPRPCILWIGLTDEGQEGTFRWVSGEPVRFQSWATGEPNNFLVNGVGENYSHISPNGTWNDLTSQGFFGVERLRLGVVEIDRPVLDVRVSELELRWNTRFGKLYQLQGRADVNGSEWADFAQPFQGKDGFVTNRVALPADGTNRLFRVVELP